MLYNGNKKKAAGKRLQDERGAVKSNQRRGFFALAAQKIGESQGKHFKTS